MRAFRAGLAGGDVGGCRYCLSGRCGRSIIKDCLYLWCNRPVIDLAYKDC